MKFVYCGYDFMLDCARALQKEGHELGGILTFPCDNIFNFNRETIALANSLNLPALIEKPKPEHIDFLIEKSCDVFIAAGYLYKLPDVAPAWGLNIHPSLLPLGRGMMPAPHILLDHPEASGVTIHKLNAEYDTGDILWQEKLPLTENETVETLMARTVATAKPALSKIMTDLPRHWSDATPQDESRASTFPVPDDQLRTLDWSLSLERLSKIARAFGHFGCLAEIGGEKYGVYAHEIRRAEHSSAPGAILSRDNGEIIVAAKGGLMILKKTRKLP